MSEYNTIGGGTIDSGDKRIQRKVIVSTNGLDPQPPGGQGRLTNVSITEEPGGIRRGIFEYTIGGEGGANYNAYGKKIELMGGSREVPIYNHPEFASLDESQIRSVQKAVDEKTGSSFSGAQNNLYQCLIRQIEYYIAPSLVARISEIESGLPSTDGLCKLSSPSGVSTPANTRWILTGISATPVGEKYEVTREYTCLQDPEAAQFLYE